MHCEKCGELRSMHHSKLKGVTEVSGVDFSMGGRAASMEEG